MGYHWIHVWIKARRGSQYPTTVTISWKLALVGLYTVPQRDSSVVQSYMSLLASLGLNTTVQSSHHTWE